MVVPRVPVPGVAVAGAVKVLLGGLLGDPDTPPQSLEHALASANRTVAAYGSLAAFGLRLLARADDGNHTRPFVIRPYRGLYVFDAAHARFYVGLKSA